MWTSLIAGLGCVVGGCLVLPSLARDEMREVASKTLRSIGVAISGCDHASRYKLSPTRCDIKTTGDTSLLHLLIQRASMCLQSGDSRCEPNRRWAS